MWGEKKELRGSLYIIGGCASLQRRLHTRSHDHATKQARGEGCRFRQSLSAGSYVPVEWQECLYHGATAPVVRRYTTSDDRRVALVGQRRGGRTCLGSLPRRSLLR